MSELESEAGLNENKAVHEAKSESELIEQPMHEEHVEEQLPEPAEDFSTLSKEELVKLMETLSSTEDINAVKQRVYGIKDAVEHIQNTEREYALSTFIEEGGNKEDFKYAWDSLDDRFQSSIKKFNKRKAEQFEQQEKSRDGNLKTKQGILNELKVLIQNEENMQRAFEVFHDLQALWRNTGAVPSGKVNDLWMTYKLYTDKFYELIKINRELQDLDQRKNMEAKMELCEKAEELIMEPSLNKALSHLHELQNRWRETGPVNREKKNEIWERFKAASNKIYQRREEFFQELKVKQSANLIAKNEMIVKLEELLKEEPAKASDWMDRSKQVIEIQNEWKKTGYADKKSNDEIWSRFKGMCDDFFKRKNDFFVTLKKEFAANLQKKSELCIQAEAMQESNDWRKTTDELKRLQQEWKQTGFVGEKQGQKIWERFRAACDKFFERKAAHYNSLGTEQQENLVKKIALAEEAEQFVAGDNGDETVEQLKAMQRKWSEIGMVPIEHKDSIFTRFKAAIDKQFQSLRKSNNERFASGHSKPASSYHSGKPGHEKNDLKHRMNQLSTEINTWENNLGFFAKSKNADTLKKEFEEKINKAKEEIRKIKQQMDEVAKAAANPS